MGTNNFLRLARRIGFVDAFYGDDHENCIFLRCMIVTVERFYLNVSGELIAMIMSVGFI